MSSLKQRTDTNAILNSTSTIKVIIFIVAIFIVKAPVISAAQVSECRNATGLMLDAQQYGFIDSETPLQRFRLELPSPGILSLLVSSEPALQRIPRLGLVNHTCDHETATPLLTLERAPGYLRVAIRAPTTLFFEVTNHQPGFALGAFQISNRFIGAQVDKIKSDPMEVDPDPGLRTPLPPKSSDPTLPIKSDPMEVDPDPGVLSPPFPHASWTQADSAGIATLLSLESAVGLETSRRLLSQFDPRVLDGRGICGLWSQSGPHSEPDDHGDSPGCATSITSGESVIGTISARDGNDHPDQDVFELTLHGLTRLEATTQGETDTFGMLYDRAGQPLAIDDDSGERGNFYLAAVLGPGTYYLQISSRGGPHGQYRLTTTDL